MRRDDTLVIWRFNRDLRHLVNTVGDLTKRSIGLKVLAGKARRSTPPPPMAASARARGRHGGRPFKMTPPKLRLAQAAMGKPETKFSELCVELSVTRQTLCRHVTPDGQIQPDGEKLLGRRSKVT